MIRGDNRRDYLQRLAADYNTGQSIRQLAARHNKSYGAIHHALTQAGVTFRPRGGANNTRRTR